MTKRQFDRLIRQFPWLWAVSQVWAYQNLDVEIKAFDKPDLPRWIENKEVWTHVVMSSAERIIQQLDPPPPRMLSAILAPFCQGLQAEIREIAIVRREEQSTLGMPIWIVILKGNRTKIVPAVQNH
ncbi:MAG TPA: hypothetical protein VD998_03910 [Verrucomicrobiae bacterium]|nr:hypothetical protein [Verrucomicrobiae bacterium]